MQHPNIVIQERNLALPRVPTAASTTPQPTFAFNQLYAPPCNCICISKVVRWSSLSTSVSIQAQLGMLAWMGGKRNKLKHARKQHGPGKHSSLNGKPVAAPASATTDKHNRQSPVALVHGASMKRARTSATAEDKLQARPAKQSRSSFAYQLDHYDQLSAQASDRRSMSGSPDQRVNTVEDSSGQDSDHEFGQPDSKKHLHNTSKQSDKAAMSLDLQAIELPT